MALPQERLHDVGGVKQIVEHVVDLRGNRVDLRGNRDPGPAQSKLLKLHQILQLLRIVDIVPARQAQLAVPLHHVLRHLPARRRVLQRCHGRNILFRTGVPAENNSSLADFLGRLPARLCLCQEKTEATRFHLVLHMHRLPLLRPLQLHLPRLPDQLLLAPPRLVRPRIAPEHVERRRTQEEVALREYQQRQQALVLEQVPADHRMQGPPGARRHPSSMCETVLRSTGEAGGDLVHCGL
mmetsp:Transcript_44479/g.109541  ORF Transcript_44479/g.109541 Transcript_44479/m.109541 type:complete len:239 (-) Transcript_44479:3170-3886(-)